MVKHFQRNSPEARAARLKEQEERDRIEEAKFNLKPGATQSEVREAWGDPDAREIYAQFLYWTYENDRQPVIFTFKEEKLVGFRYDRQSAAIQESQRLQRVQIQAEQKERRNEAIRSIGSSFQQAGDRMKTTDCTTQPNGLGGFRTSCN